MEILSHVTPSFLLLFALLWSMAPLSGTHTKSTTVIMLRGCSDRLQGLSKVGIKDTLVFLIILDELGWPPLSQRTQEAQLILIYNIINGLA